MDNSLVNAIIADACSAFPLRIFVISQLTIFAVLLMMMQAFGTLVYVMLTLA